MNYYLIDLERSVGTGIVHYWKARRFGYTTDIKEAGIYSEAEARKLVNSDLDKWTVMISEEDVKFILKN